jgi:hypothetical protein
MPGDKPEKSKTHGVLFFIAVFTAIVIVTFIFRKPASIRWIEDYQAGIQRSAQLNKPALVCFYWKNGPFTSAMRQATWRDPKAVEFVEKTFVPILVRMDDHPELAKNYGTDYDGACFIRLPDGTQSDQATHGHRPTEEYIMRLQEKLTQITSKKP